MFCCPDGNIKRRFLEFKETALSVNQPLLGEEKKSDETFEIEIPFNCCFSYASSPDPWSEIPKVISKTGDTFLVVCQPVIVISNEMLDFAKDGFVIIQYLPAGFALPVAAPRVFPLKSAADPEQRVSDFRRMKI